MNISHNVSMHYVVLNVNTFSTFCILTLLNLTPFGRTLEAVRNSAFRLTGARHSKEYPATSKRNFPSSLTLNLSTCPFEHRIYGPCRQHSIPRRPAYIKPGYNSYDFHQISPKTDTMSTIFWEAKGEIIRESEVLYYITRTLNGPLAQE